MPKPIYLYKYIGSQYLPRVFEKPNYITFKCSTPREFNDPYELFLTMDFNKEPEELAFYAEVIGELPQLPTTCFSRSPIVVPMWAHYANNHQGFVIEIDGAKLSSSLPDSLTRNVIYSDRPTRDFSELLTRAHVIAKPRYTYMLRNEVFIAAYFTKASCWSYEQERRLVVNDAQVRISDSLKLLDVSNGCVTGIICGTRSSEETKRALREKAEEVGCRYLEMNIGRSSSTPYFLDAHGATFSYEKDEVCLSDWSCDTCGEPRTKDDGKCPWCKIDDSVRSYAASRNPYRILDHLGLLDEYVDGMDAISNPKGRRPSE